MYHLPSWLIRKIGKELLHTYNPLEDIVISIVDEMEESYPIEYDVIEDDLISLCGIQECTNCGFWCKTRELILTEGDSICEACCYDDEPDWHWRIV